jgi:formamidase
MSRPFTVLGAQVRPVAFDPDATFAKFEREVRLARSTFGGAQMLLFPELYLTGDDPFAAGQPGGFMERVAEPVPGPLTERIGRVAARARRWICPGSIFEQGRAGRIYNTALVFDPVGELVVRYRKLFPWAPFEATTPGDRPAPVFDVPRVGRLGVMICYDGSFPEVARGLALQGAELILHPTLTTTQDREQELIMARANAIANQCFVMNVNAVPSFGGGRSIGVDPEGHVIFELGQTEEFAVAAVDLERARQVRERGTGGLNRLLAQLEGAPKAAFEPYRRLLGRRTR